MRRGSTSAWQHGSMAARQHGSMRAWQPLQGLFLCQLVSLCWMERRENMNVDSFLVKNIDVLSSGRKRCWWQNSSLGCFKTRYSWDRTFHLQALTKPRQSWMVPIGYLLQNKKLKTAKSLEKCRSFLVEGKWIISQDYCKDTVEISWLDHGQQRFWPLEWEIIVLPQFSTPWMHLIGSSNVHSSQSDIRLIICRKYFLT